MTLALGALLLGTFASTALAIETRYRVDLELLECREESNEMGSDDPYAIMVGVNLRTGEVRTTTRCFLDVESGHARTVAQGKAMAFDAWLEKPTDGFIIAALLEFDRSFGTGYVMVDGQFHVPSRNPVDAAVRAVATKYHLAYSKGLFPRGTVLTELFQAMRSAIDGSRGGDDFLGMGELEPAIGSATPQLTMNGDGSHYILHFRRQNLGTRPMASFLPTPPKLVPVQVGTKLRIRLRDAQTNAALPVAARVFSGNKIVHQSDAPATSWIETALPMGQYRIQVRSTLPDYEMITRDVQIGGQDVNLTLLLKKVASGAGTGSSYPPPGRTQWVYAWFPSVHYQRDPSIADRWQEMDGNAVKQNFRVIPSAGQYLALRDEVRAIWLRLYTDRCEISEDGVNFRPWFPGSWK